MTDIPAHILPLLTPEQVAQYQGYLDAMSGDEIRRMRRRGAVRRRKMLSTGNPQKQLLVHKDKARPRLAYSGR